MVLFADGENVHEVHVLFVPVLHAVLDQLLEEVLFDGGVLAWDVDDWWGWVSVRGMGEAPFGDGGDCSSGVELVQIRLYILSIRNLFASGPSCSVFLQARECVIFPIPRLETETTYPLSSSTTLNHAFPFAYHPSVHAFFELSMTFSGSAVPFIAWKTASS